MHFNFLPWRAKRDRQRQIRFYGLLVLAGTLTGSVQLWVFSDLESVAQKQAIAIRDQGAHLAKQEAILADWTAKQVAIEQSNQAMQAAQALLVAFNKASQPVGQFLLDLMAARPPGAWIEHLQIRSDWVDGASASLERSNPSVLWQVKLSGHAVLETDPMRYREALTRHFGDHHRPNSVAASHERPVIGSTDPAEADSDVPIASPGLISFAIEQWIEREPQ